MSGDETAGQQRPQQRPGATIDTDPVVEPRRDREDRERRETPTDGVSLETGPRRTGNVTILVQEAKLAAAGEEIGNPAQPVTPRVAKAFEQQTDDDLEPAWLRPWEADSE